MQYDDENRKQPLVWGLQKFLLWIILHCLKKSLSWKSVGRLDSGKPVLNIYCSLNLPRRLLTVWNNSQRMCLRLVCYTSSFPPNSCQTVLIFYYCFSFFLFIIIPLLDGYIEILQQEPKHLCWMQIKVTKGSQSTTGRHIT